MLVENSPERRDFVSLELLDGTLSNVDTLIFRINFFLNSTKFVVSDSLVMFLNVIFSTARN